MACTSSWEFHVEAAKFCAIFNLPSCDLPQTVCWSIFKLSSARVTHSLVYTYYAVHIVGLLARAVASHVLALPAHPKLSLQF